MRHKYSEIRAAGGDVIAIGFAPIEMLRKQTEELDLPYPFLHDPDRTAYRTLGLGRATWWQVYGPATWWTYARLLLRGHRLRRTEVDGGQLGGDIVVDADGRITLARASRTPTDRPPVAELLAALRGGPGSATG